MTREEENKALLSAAEEGDVESLKAALAAGADVNVVNEDGDTALAVAARRRNVSCVEILKAAGAEGDYDIQQEDEDGAEDYDDEDYDDEDGEKGITVWEGEISRMWEYQTCEPQDLPKLINVGENDRLMFVRVCADEASCTWGQEQVFIIIFLMKENTWESICWPMLPYDDADPHFPENWSWYEILDQVWDGKTVTYTTKLNEDYDQVEATWEVEE